MTDIDIFSPFRLGPLDLPNRIVMAPMTRNRAGPGNVPTALNAAYYAQRASAGLIIAEASQVSAQGLGYPGTPGIHSAEQIAGWKLVTDAVHDAGGRIFLQLWHVGRISHPSLQPDGALPVAPSAIAPAGQAWTLDGMKPYVTPRALDTAELSGIVAQYRRGAENAKAAGFDGVEVHAAHGYLLDQFLRDSTNRRSDAYGGSAANRVRLLAEVMEAVAEVWGGDRTGVHLSPTNLAFNDISDSDPAATFSTAMRALDSLGLGYLHIVEPGPGDPVSSGPRLDAAFFPSAVAQRTHGQQGLRSCPRQRGIARRRRRSGVVRHAVHRQPGLAGALEPRRAVQSARPQDLLWRCRQGLYGLSEAVICYLYQYLIWKERCCDAGHFTAAQIIYG